MSYPKVFYSPVAIVSKDEENARTTKLSIIIERYKNKVSTLHTNDDNHLLCKYEGFWYYHGFYYHSKADFSVETIMALQDDFEALPTDVFLTSHPKSGTTWLKALSFAILNRTKFKLDPGSRPHHPLLTISPHDCVPFMETGSFLNNPCYANGLMATHIPYTSLPKSIVGCSDCRIVYLCRNPKDVLISYWHFMNKLKDDDSIPAKLDDVFELFSGGKNAYGSFWDHVIGYYKASLEHPDKVFFLKYEDLKKDPESAVKKLAKFIGKPFTEEEEYDGLVQKIIELCDFQSLREANKGGEETSSVLSDDIYFRKGVVGDSANYLTAEMIRVLEKITKEKCDGLDFSFGA